MTRPAVLRIGLTGGIASGKSTVAAVLRKRGAYVLDLDLVAHEVMALNGAAYDGVLRRFGPEIVAADGTIDRKRLGAIVFADPAALAELNALVHPHVRREWQRRVDEFAKQADNPCIAIVEAALLVETGQHRELDGLVVVRCNRDTQLRRLIARDGLSAAEAERRIDAQAPVQVKVDAADWIVDTDGPLEATVRQANAVYDDLFSRCN